jgi:hypothetical protein
MACARRGVRRDADDANDAGFARRVRGVGFAVTQMTQMTQGLHGVCAAASLARLDPPKAGSGVKPRQTRAGRPADPFAVVEFRGWREGEIPRFRPISPHFALSWQRAYGSPSEDES